MLAPIEPKIYHIVHADRLPSIVADGYLWCDGYMAARSGTGTPIGISSIKQRRLNELTLSSAPGLHVGDCVPFYFCPRSVMLYVIHMGNNPQLGYHGGQGPIAHLEADLGQTVAWANAHGRRWAFTLSNAGARYFDDYADLAQLDRLNWDAIRASKWSGVGVAASVKESKQAEFLVEEKFPWELVSRIGVQSRRIYDKVVGTLQASRHRPAVDIRRDWYY